MGLPAEVTGEIPLTRMSTTEAGVAQLVELQPSKLDVASSNLVSRSIPLAPASTTTPRRFQVLSTPSVEGAVVPT